MRGRWGGRNEGKRTLPQIVLNKAEVVCVSGEIITLFPHGLSKLL